MQGKDAVDSKSNRESDDIALSLETWRTFAAGFFPYARFL